MAINGSFYGTTGNAAIKPKISWSAVTELEENCSQVTATLSYSRTDGYMTYGHWAGTLTVNGEKASVSGKYLEITKNSNTVAITHTVRVPHNDDGTKTVTITATGSISGTTLTKTTISGDVALEKIPRAASIAATDGDIGSVSMVTIGKKSDAYTYTVAYRFGSLQGYLSENGLSQEAAFVTASGLAFPLPESFYYEIPDKPSDSCTLVCTTFLNGSAIGTPQTCTFTVRAAPERCGPVLTADVRDVNENTLALTGDQNTFIRYVSTALCTVTAQARYGASITRKKIAGKTLSANTLTLERIDTDTVLFTAKDSRGYTAQTQMALELLPYFLPVLRVRAERTDATGGGATLQAEGSFYNGDFNSLGLQYQLEDGTAVQLQPQIDGNRFTAAATLENLDYTRAYTVTVTLADQLSTKVVHARINPGVPVFDWGGGDFRFHVPVELSGCRLTGLADPADGADAVTKSYADGNFLKNSGRQTLNGNLAIEGNASVNQYLAVDSTDDYPRVLFRDASGSQIARIHAAASTNRIYFYEHSPDGADFQEQYRLPKPDNLTKDMLYEILTTKNAGTVKLWENASPTSLFTAQTIALDLQDYRMVLCLFRLSTETVTVVPATFAVVGGNACYSYGLVSGYPVRRTVSATTTGVKIEEGCRYTSFGSTNVNAKNTNLIPVAIYGIKGVF